MTLKWPLIVFLSLAGIAVFILVKAQTPEQRLTGRWEEVLWQYERMDPESHADTDWLVVMDEQIKSEVSKELIVHEAEIWEFDDDHTLRLRGQDKDETLQWKLKGRGDVLQLFHHDQHREAYQLKVLNEDSLILHFNTDLQARGIVKMIFKRVEE